MFLCFKFFRFSGTKSTLYFIFKPHQTTQFWVNKVNKETNKKCHQAYEFIFMTPLQQLSTRLRIHQVRQFEKLTINKDKLARKWVITQLNNIVRLYFFMNDLDAPQ